MGHSRRCKKVRRRTVRQRGGGPYGDKPLKLVSAVVAAVVGAVGGSGKAPPAPVAAAAVVNASVAVEPPSPAAVPAVVEPAAVAVVEEPPSPAAVGGAGKPPPAPAPDVNSTPRLIGKGSYGTVYYPAYTNIGFENIKDREKWVTKNFKDFTYYEKALKMARLIKEVGFNYEIIPYKDNPKNLLNPVRMPYKGKSIPDIIKNKEDVEALKTVEFHVFFFQIYKNLKILNRLFERRLIHGDIHPGNILVEPTTGEITIIDFDLFNPITEFATTYNRGGVFSYPPEAIVYNNTSDYRSQVEDYCNNFRQYFRQDIDEVTIKSYIEAYRNYTYGYNFGPFQTFDSFAFANSIMLLFNTIKPGYFEHSSVTALDAKSKALVRRVLVPMASTDFRHRITAPKGLTNMVSIVGGDIIVKIEELLTPK